MFIGERYNIMTTNIVEALNSTLKRAREYPLLLLLNSIVEKMVECFNKRREKAQNLTSPLISECERRLHLFGQKLGCWHQNGLMQMNGSSKVGITMWWLTYNG